MSSKDDTNYQKYLDHFVPQDKRGRLQQEVSDGDLKEIAKGIPKWEVNLANPLGISNDEIQDIKGSSGDVVLRRLEE